MLLPLDAGPGRGVVQGAGCTQTRGQEGAQEPLGRPPEMSGDLRKCFSAWCEDQHSHVVLCSGPSASVGVAFREPLPTNKSPARSNLWRWGPIGGFLRPAEPQNALFRLQKATPGFSLKRGVMSSCLVPRSEARGSSSLARSVKVGPRNSASGGLELRGRPTPEITRACWVS